MKRLCLLVLAGLILLASTAPGQVSQELQNQADQLVITTQKGELNVGTKLAGLEALREQTLSAVDTKLNAKDPNYNLRAQIDKLADFGSYCSKLATLIEGQKPNATEVIYWLRANAYVAGGFQDLYASEKPFTESAALTSLNRISSFRKRPFEGRLGYYIEQLRQAASDPGRAEQAACFAQLVRSASGYSTAGKGIDTLELTLSDSTVPPNTPVVANVQVTMKGEGDCKGETTTFKLDVEGQPGYMTETRKIRPGASFSDQIFTIDTRTLKPGPHHVNLLVTDSAGLEKKRWGSFTIGGGEPATIVTYRGNFSNGVVLTLTLDFSSGAGRVRSGTIERQVPNQKIQQAVRGIQAPVTLLNQQMSDDFEFTATGITSSPGPASGRGSFVKGLPSPGTQSFDADVIMTDATSQKTISNHRVTMTRIN